MKLAGTRAVLGALIAFVVADAGARDHDLDTWVAGDLVPYLRQQLTTMPRFVGEPVRFVVMREGTPHAAGSELELELRDRVASALADTPGVHVVLPANDAGLLNATGSIDCERGNATYLVGIEFGAAGNGTARVDVRALDVEENRWVAGFGRSWLGTLAASERRALRTLRPDPTFRGERQSPFAHTESDLLAGHLAYRMACELLRQSAGEYIVAEENGDDDPAASLVELVGNNLARYRALLLAGDDSAANAWIEGKAHPVDDDLYQYWITIRPRDANSGLPTLSASAYVHMPNRYASAALVPEATFDFAAGDGEFLERTRLVALREREACALPGSRVPGWSPDRSRLGTPNECYALQVHARDDAVVFFLNHQLNNGLVRLADRTCGDRAAARIARVGETLRFPLPADTLASASWSAAETWSLQPAGDTYYVVATTNSKAARALAQHVASLPNRCTASVRRGIEGVTLRHWLDELDAIAARWPSSVDWQSVRVRNVY